MTPPSSRKLPFRLSIALAFGLLLTLLLAAEGTASIWVANDARRPKLRVNAAGVAEVRWKDTKGVRHSLLIPRTGKVLPEGRLKGKNVATRTRAVQIPMKRVLLRTPNGWFWALQTWQRSKGGPVELRFSSWKGDPTVLAVEAVCCRTGSETVQGTVSFRGKPVHGTSPTPGGKRIRIQAAVDCFGCSGAAGWSRISTVPTRKPDGSYRLWIRPAWQSAKYRVTVTGPNRGKQRAPDMRGFAASALP